MPQSLRAVLRMAQDKHCYVVIETTDDDGYRCGFERYSVEDSLQVNHFTDIDDMTAWLAKKVSE